MLYVLVSSWIRQANDWIILLYRYIFPEYPDIGLTVFVASAAFFVYYLFRGKFSSAVKMSLTTLITTSFLLYCIHWLIKLFRIAI